ncbi:MAG: glycosyltransferase family 87 protein [Mesorhizobium sp.]
MVQIANKTKRYPFDFDERGVGAVRAAGTHLRMDDKMAPLGWGTRMGEQQRNIKLGLLALGVFHLVYFCFDIYGSTIGIKGVLYADGNPVGGDFINLWTAAKLVLADRVSDIYRVGDFMAYQRTITGGTDIYVRLWAYPPHSLLLIWPFGLVGYYTALAVWSAAGLMVLAAGAWRCGFDRTEIAIILLSPATILNLYYGQTGSFATGALLLAVSARSKGDPVSVGSSALLTIKPQAGFLLPVIWAFQRRWRMIAYTACCTIVVAILAVAVFGVEPWRDYVGDTLPTLSRLEREGNGAFMMMIPSMFMSLRILTGDWAFAFGAHACFAIAVGIIVALRLWQVQDARRQLAMMLFATALMTPYIHNYDLAILLCGALLVARRWASAQKQPFGIDLLILMAWALPQLVFLFNRAGVPISPLVILPLLLLA